jgi:hypothetical protein
MAKWIELTTPGGKNVMVSLDQVTMIQDTGNYAVVHFNGGHGDGHFMWSVTETLSQITPLLRE